MRKLLAFALVSLLAGCAQYVLVEPKKPVKVRDAFTVEAGTAWNRIDVGKVEVWTVDGPALQSLMFFSPLKDADAMFANSYGAKEDQGDFPKYRESMNELEIAEFVETSLTKANGVPVSNKGLTRARFLGLDGFRMSVDFTGKDEVEREGFVLGAIKDKKLYLALYWGTKLHHYGLYKEEAERIAGSARFN